MKLRLRSAAKVNLTLDILSRRADGYHELASVVHTVGWWDEISVELWQDGALAFSCNRPELQSADNLCVRAVRLWNEAARENFGARIRLEKRIPTGAGLGGGSGNAAAMLLALQRAAQKPLPGEKLAEIAAKLGADVPLFLRGGALLMQGIGDKTTALSPLAGWLLIFKPELSLSTPAIYRAWDEGAFVTRGDTPALLRNWGALHGVAAHLGNDLERAAAQLSVVPARCVALLRETGASGAQMSGSGSACFSLFDTENAARAAEKRLRSELAKDVHPEAAQLFVAPFCETGVTLE